MWWVVLFFGHTIALADKPVEDGVVKMPSRNIKCIRFCRAASPGGIISEDGMSIHLASIVSLTSGYPKSPSPTFNN